MYLCVCLSIHASVHPSLLGSVSLVSEGLRGLIPQPLCTICGLNHLASMVSLESCMPKAVSSLNY